MKPAILAALVLLALAQIAAAGAPQRAAPPEARPPMRGVIASALPDGTIRPHPRPKAAMRILAPLQAPRPDMRPKAVVQKAMTIRRRAARGQICGDPSIQGEAVGLVPGRIRGCGVRRAVRVRAVSGVALSTSAVMDCTTARALNTWTARALKPGFGSRGGGVARMRVAAGYACRPRNNRKGAKISEHGKGHAIDIAGFALRDGTGVSVRKGWNSRTWGRLLHALHDAACGPFGTVLGPAANRLHRNHFHFDTARYRAGAYCR